MGQAFEKGKAELWAAWRQGQKELAQILPAFPSSVQPVNELGGFGNPTQLEVNQEKGEAPRQAEREQIEPMPERER